MSEYYIDLDSNLFEKKGIDIRVQAGIQTMDGLRLANDREISDILNPQITVKEIAQKEHQWVKSELESVQVELMYHWTDDSRASSTPEKWKEYARLLRDYTSTDDNGSPSIIGESRPVKPVNPEA